VRGCIRHVLVILIDVREQKLCSRQDIDAINQATLCFTLSRAVLHDGCLNFTPSSYPSDLEEIKIGDYSLSMTTTRAFPFEVTGVANTLVPRSFFIEPSAFANYDNIALCSR